MTKEEIEQAAIEAIALKRDIEDKTKRLETLEKTIKENASPGDRFDNKMVGYAVNLIMRKTEVLDKEYILNNMSEAEIRQVYKPTKTDLEKLNLSGLLEGHTSIKESRSLMYEKIVD